MKVRKTVATPAQGKANVLIELLRELEILCRDMCLELNCREVCHGCSLPTFAWDYLSREDYRKIILGLLASVAACGPDKVLVKVYYVRRAIRMTSGRIMSMKPCRRPTRLVAVMAA